MGKGDKRGKAKRNQAAFAVTLAGAPRPKKRGKARMTEMKTEHDPRKIALDARCRMFGVDTTKANRDALSGQHNGSQLGLVLEYEYANAKHHIPPLWDTWQGFAKAERTYRLRYLGQSGTAKGASIAMVPDRMETDKSPTIDMRTQEQRDREAVANWMRWRGYMDRLDVGLRTLLHDLEQDREGALWANNKPTQRGLMTLAALRRLRAVVEG